MASPASSVSAWQFCDHWWREICKKVKRSTVFVDAEAVEALHWAGGLRRLEAAGVQGVREFSSFEACDDGVKKAVFLVSGPVAGLKKDILREIVSNSSFEYIQIVTDASPAVHRSHAILADGRDSSRAEEAALFGELEQEALEWMGNPGFTCEVFSFPFHSASPVPGLLITPAFARSVFPLLEVDLERAAEMWREANAAASTDAQQQPAVNPAQVFFNLLPPKLQVSVHHLAACLHAHLQMVGAAEDIFTVGPFSRVVGEQLEAWQPARNRRKVAGAAGTGGARDKISLVLVDRTLDLAGPTTSRADTVLGRLASRLPRLPGHSSGDLGVNLSALFGLEPRHTDEELLPPGCLASSEEAAKEQDLGLDKLVCDDEDTVVKDYFNYLAKARGMEEKDQVDIEDLESLLATFSGDEEAIAGNLDVLSRASAIVGLRGAQQSKKAARMSDVEERFVRASSKSAKETRGFLVQLAKLVRERRDRGLSLEDLLALTAHCYALASPDAAGEFYPEDEDRLQSALSEAIVRDWKASPAGGGLGPTLSAMVAEEESVDEIVAFRTVKKIFQKLDSVRKARGVLKGYKSLLVEDESASDGGKKTKKYKGFLEQILEDVFAEDRREVSDLEHRTGGLGGLLKSGIGLFGVNVSRTHPRENPEVWVFVVGGITADEVATARRVVARGSSGRSRLLVGGTKLISREETLASLFANCPLLGSQ